jgi:hypothetical protein
VPYMVAKSGSHKDDKKEVDLPIALNSATVKNTTRGKHFSKYSTVKIILLQFKETHKRSVYILIKTILICF